MSEFARLVELNPGDVAGWYIDGKEFPWKVAPDIQVNTEGRGLHIVTVRIFAKQVLINNRDYVAPINAGGDA
jgi:hypothetical protein